MPNIKSAKKELRKSEKRHEYNLTITKNLKAMVKKTRQAIETKDAQAATILQTTMKALDKAAQKGVIKTNNRNRNKSRLQQQFNHSQK